jgi:predicted transcriptional regulator
MKKIIMSIKPEYVNKIFTGEKRFEYRRACPQCCEGKTVIIYCTAPVSKVVGEFKIVDGHREQKEVIWNMTKDKSGISEEAYYKYFEGRDFAIALKIDDVIKYEKAREIKEYGFSRPPQNFYYTR